MSHEHGEEKEVAQRLNLAALEFSRGFKTDIT